jgi:predicted nucleic acid-binding protein
MFFIALLIMLYAPIALSNDFTKELSIINKKRKIDLEMNQKLNEIAQSQAIVIATQRYCDHNGFLGEDLATRAKNAGYPWISGRLCLLMSFLAPSTIRKV